MEGSLSVATISDAAWIPRSPFRNVHAPCFVESIHATERARNRSDASVCSGRDSTVSRACSTASDLPSGVTDRSIVYFAGWTAKLNVSSAAAGAPLAVGHWPFHSLRTRGAPLSSLTASRPEYRHGPAVPELSR